MIKIKSKLNNFRRCGVAHPAETVTWSDDRFTAAELLVLQSEPMLIVEAISERPDDSEPGIQIGTFLPEPVGDRVNATESGKEPAKAAKPALSLPKVKGKR